MVKPRCLAYPVAVLVALVCLSFVLGCDNDSSKRVVFSDNYHGDRVTAVAFSPFSDVFASAGEDDSIRLFDAAGIGSTVYRPKELRGSPLRGHGSAVSSLAFSSVASRFGAGNFRQVTGGYVQVWDLLESPWTRQEYGGPIQPVRGVAFSPEGDRLALAAGDVVHGGVYLVSLGDSSPAELLFEARGGASSVAFSADGARLAAATPDGVRLWDFHSNEALAIEEEGFWPAAVLFDPVEPWILYAAGRYNPSGFAGIHGAVMVFDLQSEVVNSIKLSGLPLRTLACSSQGELLAAAGDDNAVYVIQPKTASERLTLVGHYGPVNSLSFSRDSTLLVSGSDDKFVRVWYVGDLLASEDSETSTGSGSDSASETHSSQETDSQTESSSFDPEDTASFWETGTSTDPSSDTETQASTDTETAT